jgi:hypothetical protein
MDRRRCRFYMEARSKRMTKFGKMVHDAPTVNHVETALKDAYDSPGGQEVASAFQDASMLAHHGK